MLARFSFSDQHPLRRWAAALVVGLFAALLALAAGHTWPFSLATERLDHVFYDSFYRLRAPADLRDGSVVIVAADEESFKALGAAIKLQWPWPRDVWGHVLGYVDGCGPRAVLFDVTFTEPSKYAATMDDDQQFADALDAAKSPVVMAARVGAGGRSEPFAVPATRPVRFGAANVSGGSPARTYAARVHGVPSLARAGLDAAGAGKSPPPADSFLLHYYGPHKRADGGLTFRYVSAANVLYAALKPADAAKHGITPALFRDKVVLIGAIAQGTYDEKASPLSAVYPGVELHATAIENMLRGQYVRPLGGVAVGAAAVLAALLAAMGAIVPGRTWAKVLAPAAVIVAVAAGAALLFQGQRIVWLAPTLPLAAAAIATVGALAWSYAFADRRRRFLLKALSRHVSPAVAAELTRDPTKLALGSERREMTVMFTDIAGFTALSEELEVEDLTTLLNFYLDEMSKVVFEADGTLDKYIGDAIMSFWNAPLPQPDHALRACRVALGMARREAGLRPELARFGAEKMFTRLGIHTGPMAVGYFGSAQQFAYTVFGDSVNLASRLEGSNKLYGSQICLSQTTADLVREQFRLRKLDVLRVPGKRRPMAVYELLSDDVADARLASLAARYEAAFDLYQHQRWDEADRALEALLVDEPNDAPSLALRKRIIAFRAEPPGAEWDGVYVSKQK